MTNPTLVDDYLSAAFLCDPPHLNKLHASIRGPARHRLVEIAAQCAAAKEYFSGHDTRADEFKDRQHVDTVEFLLSLIKAISD